MALLGLKRLNNKIFYICLGFMAVLIYVTDLPDLTDFSTFVSYIFKVALFTLGAYCLTKALSLISEILNSRGRLSELETRLPQLAPYEEKRIQVLTSMLKFVLGIVGCVLAFVLLIPLITIIGNVELAGMIIYLGAFAIICALPKILQDPYEKAEIMNIWFKKSLVEDELNKHFEDVVFETDNCISGGELLQLGLFFDANDSLGNDLITATRNGVKFSCSDMKLRKEVERHDNKGNVYYSYNDIFSGVVFKFDNTSYRSRLLINSTGFPNVQGVLTQFDKVIGAKRDDFLDDTESVVFNDIFDVYTRNKFNSRMILTPNMIDGMTRLYKIINKKILLLFQGTTMYLFVSMPRTDRFEVSFVGGKSIEEQYNDAVKNVQMMVDIVDNMPFAFELKFEE